MKQEITFQELLRESTITTGLLAIILVVGWIYFIAAKITYPQQYDLVIIAVIGYFFGSSVTKAMTRTTIAAAQIAQASAEQTAQTLTAAAAPAIIPGLEDVKGAGKDQKERNTP